MSTGIDIGDQLEKLERLRQAGSLSDADYAQAKARLLNGGDIGGYGRNDLELDFDHPGAKAGRPAAGSQEAQTRQWAMFLHLSLLAGYLIPFAGLAAPVVIWQIKKDELPGLDIHGKNAVNWLISHLIYFVACIPLCFIAIGLVLLPILLVVSVVFPIVAAVKGHRGEVWAYPMAIQFLK